MTLKKSVQSNRIGNILRNKSTAIAITFALLYFFRQCVFYIKPEIGYQLVGNLDLFYLIGVAYVVLHYKKITAKEKICIVIIYAYILFQWSANSDIDVLRAIINVSKIVICYFVMKYSTLLVSKYRPQLKIITMIFGLCCGVFLIIALIFYNSNILWRLNDTVNVFNLHRLQLLYTEPGELGMHCSIMLILAVYIAIQNKQHRIIYCLISILPVVICLSFTKSLGGIAIGCIGIAIVLLSDLYINFSKQKLTLYCGLLIVAMALVIIMIITKNTLYLRIISAFSNTDSSSRYRITMAFQLVPKILFDTFGMGVGFGNLELPYNVAKYRQYGMNSAGIINSFMNLFAESGIAGIVMFIGLEYSLLSSCIKSRRPDKNGLFAFLFIYQFMGTYFTNPLLWILYGFIMANMKDKYADRSDKKIVDAQATSRKNVLFIEQCVDMVGGVERVINTLATELSSSHNVTILSETQEVQKSFFHYDHSITKYYLFNRLSGILHNPYTIGTPLHSITEKLQKLIVATERPFRIYAFFRKHPEIDVVIFGRTAIATHFLPTLSRIKEKPKKIIVRDAIHLYYAKNRERKTMLRYFPNMVDVFVVSSDESILQYKTFFQSQPIKKMVKIYNPIAIDPTYSWNPQHKTITAIGRIDDDQKGFSILIPTMRIVAQKYPDWKLLIYGDGAYRAKIQERIQDLQMTNIKIHSYTKNIKNVFKNTAIFVFPSRYEGYANTLVEALACGIPSITFNWLLGSEEIIQDHKNGIIVQLTNRMKYYHGENNYQDAENLANSICDLISNETLTTNISKEATKITSSRNKKHIIQEWRRIIDN